MVNCASSRHSCMYEFAISNIIASTICAHSKPHVQKEKYTSHLISQLENNAHQNLRSAYRKLILVEIIDMIVKDERLTVNSTRQPEMFLTRKNYSNYQEHLQVNLQQLKNNHQNYNNKLYIRMKLHRAKQLLLNLSPNSSNFKELSPDLHSGQSNALEIH